jgi:hypothetical protein
MTMDPTRTELLHDLQQNVTMLKAPDLRSWLAQHPAFTLADHDLQAVLVYGAKFGTLTYMISHPDYVADPQSIGEIIDRRVPNEYRLSTRQKNDLILMIIQHPTFVPDATTLFDCLQDCTLVVIKMLLDDPRIDPNFIPDDYHGLLWLASERSDILPFILAHPRVDVNIYANNGMSSFETICEDFNNEIIEPFLQCDRLQINHTIFGRDVKAQELCSIIKCGKLSRAEAILSVSRILDHPSFIVWETLVAYYDVVTDENITLVTGHLKHMKRAADRHAFKQWLNDPQLTRAQYRAKHHEPHFVIADTLKLITAYADGYLAPDPRPWRFLAICGALSRDIQDLIANFVHGSNRSFVLEADLQAALLMGL